MSSPHCRPGYLNSGITVLRLGLPLVCLSTLLLISVQRVCGDEPWLIAWRSGAPVAVAVDRFVAAQALLAEVENQDPNQALITNLAQERQINTFFRTDSAEIIENLPQLPSNPSDKDVFLALRECRNSW